MCIAYVYTGLMFEKIKREDSFWENKMKVKLKTFYLESMLPQLINEIN